MSRKIKDTDYLFATAYVRAKEAKLLKKEQYERIIDSRSYQDGAKALEEYGYENVSGMDEVALENYLSSRREKLISDVRFAVPDKALVDAFTIKYDYHNLKVLIKSSASGSEGNELLSSSGSIPEGKIREAYHASDLALLPPAMAAGIREAGDALGRTGDPQLADVILDKAYFLQLLNIGADSGSAFLTGYAMLSIDSANLRAAVRLTRIGKDAAFMLRVLASGGNISAERVVSAFTTGRQISALYTGSGLAAAAAEGEAAIQKNGSLTKFEKLCDDAVTKYLSAAKYSGFGETAVIGYVYAVENELASVRVILTELKAGLPAKVIRERLRDSYV